MELTTQVSVGMVSIVWVHQKEGVGIQLESYIMSVPGDCSSHEPKPRRRVHNCYRQLVEQFSTYQERHRHRVRKRGCLISAFATKGRRSENIGLLSSFASYIVHQMMDYKDVPISRTATIRLPIPSLLCRPSSDEPDVKIVMIVQYIVEYKATTPIDRCEDFVSCSNMCWRRCYFDKLRYQTASRARVHYGQ